MDFEFLKRSSVIAVDWVVRAYLIQRAGHQYPLPDAVNTYVNGHRFTTNWAMNEPIHREAASNTRPVLPWRVNSPNSMYEQDHPPLEVSEHMMEPEHAEENDDNDEEKMPHQDADEAGPSNLRRRGREEWFEQEIISINERLENLEVSVQQVSDRQEAHWAQFNAQNEAHWAQFTTQSNTQWANFNALYDERWNL